MRICIDLDGVICELRGAQQGYENLKPLPGAAEKIKALKEQGHYIIIYTARRMKTHHGNVGAIIADIGGLTLEWLKKYNIPYDEIHFGKPWAQVYIDDNAFRFEDWKAIAPDCSCFPENRETLLRGQA